MDLEKLIKKAAKTYNSGEADKIISQASHTANRMFNELVPEKAKEHELIKGLKEVADEVLADPKKNATSKSSADPLVKSLQQGLKGLRKTADRYAEKIDNDTSNKSVEEVADLATDLLGNAEKLGKTFFSRRKTHD